MKQNVVALPNNHNLLVAVVDRHGAITVASEHDLCCFLRSTLGLAVASRRLPRPVRATNTTQSSEHFEERAKVSLGSDAVSRGEHDLTTKCLPLGD
jgi:hypothetical protein